MRAFRVLALLTTLTGLVLPVRAPAQERLSPSDLEALKAEIRRLQDRVNQREQAQQPRIVPAQPRTQAPPPAPPPVAAPAPVPGETEISLGKDHPFELIGLPKPQIGETKFSGFFVGSFNYNSATQIVPEFAGGAPAQSDPGSTSFRFDKFGFGVSRNFASWLSAAAQIEVESHRDSHSHLTCPAGAGGTCIERFGSEEPETEVNLDLFHLTAVDPIGNGLALSFGRFDVPFGIERHDEPLMLTATHSEVFDFGRPEKMTGVQAAYAFAPWLDATVWLVNRWESETTHDPFDDNNRDKSFGGRIGFTPLARDSLLNFGIGAFYGPEEDDDNSRHRWVIDADFTWSPWSRFLVTGEAIYGGEDRFSSRQVGEPVPAPASTRDVNWWGFYILTYYRFLDWLGGSFRYGHFDDIDGVRTGVEQVLQSFTSRPSFISPG